MAEHDAAKTDVQQELLGRLEVDAEPGFGFCKFGSPSSVDIDRGQGLEVAVTRSEGEFFAGLDVSNAFA